jgi:uncharacterized membrane protein
MLSFTFKICQLMTENFGPVTWSFRLFLFCLLVACAVGQRARQVVPQSAASLSNKKQLQMLAARKQMLTPVRTPVV